MTAIAIPRPRNALLDRLRTIQIGVGARGAVGAGLATQRGGAASVPDWWAVAGKTCIAAYQPKGAATLAASYVNLANPGTYDAVPGVAPSHNPETGWAFNGIGQYLLTNIVATNAQSWLLRIANATQQGGGAFGCYDPGKVNVNFYPKYLDGNRYFRCSGNVTQSAPADFATGVAGGTPEAAYWNGSSVGVMAGNLTGSSTITIYLGCMVDPTNIPPPPEILWPGAILAFALYSDTLASSDMADKYTAIAAL